MEVKDLKVITDQINEEIKRMNGLYAEIQKEIVKKAPVERIEDLIKKNEASEVKLLSLSSQFDNLELKLKDRTIGNKKFSLFSDFEKAYKEKGKDLAKSPGGNFVFEMKGNPRYLLKASTIDEATELSDSDMGTAVVVPMRTPGVEALPDRRITLLDIMGRGVTGSNRVTWVERSARTEGAAAVTNDYGQYGQSDMTYIMKVAEVEKIGTFVKVTNEALEDWDELMTQIRNELFPMVERALESECYSGSGTAPHLDGIITTAKAYSSTALNKSIQSANNMDLIVAACNQLEEYNYFANYAMINPTDYRKMLLSKGSDGNYVVPPFADPSRLAIDGVRPVRSNLVTAGQLLVGDFSKVTLYIKRNIEVKIWDQDSTDPEYDLKTITASVRAAVKFPTVHQYAFVYDALADIQSAIELVGG
jgi:HK97 family phage major capsid protein